MKKLWLFILLSGCGSGLAPLSAPVAPPQVLQVQEENIPETIFIQGFSSSSIKSGSEHYDLTSVFGGMTNQETLRSETTQWHPVGFKITKEGP